MRSIGSLKRAAKSALSGNYGILILGSLAGYGISFLGSMLTMALFPADSVLSTILSQIFAVILSLILSVVTAGFSYMLLKVSRGENCVLADLFYFFRNHPDRVIVASTVLAAIDVAAMIPSTYYSLAVDMGTTFEAQMEWMSTYSMILLATSVLTMLLGIPFAMMYFLLADNSRMSGMEAVKASVRIMKGKIGKYLLLQLSFFPLLFLSVFTLYIALLWILPYMQMASAMFYRDILGDLDAPGRGEGPYTLNEQPKNPARLGDDYNSEA